jgi:hypothetical protein
MAESTIRIGRREFTLQGVLALLGGATITVAGCSGSRNNGNPGAPTAGQNAPASISANHGHTGIISSAELSAGNAITLDIMGGANHPHSVTLSGNEVMSIANGQTVSKTSSFDDFHSHEVSFTRAA